MTKTVDDLEIEKFQKMASEWWDPKGKFKPLHMLNPCRLDYINSQISYEFDLDLKKDLPFKNLSILDIGCGGGLTGDEKFDVILNMEVVEHVLDTKIFLRCCNGLLKSKGLMICSTINRNLKSYLMAIVGAEYVMRWLPKGTHDWNKFIKPNELAEMLGTSGLKQVDKRGFIFNPVSWSWSLSEKDLSVNYVTTSIKTN